MTAQLQAIYSMKHQKISYIGHSQGTTQMFAQLSDNGYQIMHRIDMFIALAPIVHMENIKREQIKQAAQNWEELYYTLHYALRLYEFNDRDSHK